MPFRCTKCRTLSANDTNNICPKGCDMERVEVIHLLVPEGGFGIVRGAQEVRDPDNETKTIRQLLKLGCESTAPSPTASSAHCAVTCLACLKNFPADDEVKEE